jgi:hypothetical protein
LLCTVVLAFDTHPSASAPAKYEPADPSERAGGGLWMGSSTARRGHGGPCPKPNALAGAAAAVHPSASTCHELHPYDAVASASGVPFHTTAAGQALIQRRLTRIMACGLDAAA